MPRPRRKRAILRLKFRIERRAFFYHIGVLSPKALGSFFMLPMTLGTLTDNSHSPVSHDVVLITSICNNRGATLRTHSPEPREALSNGEGIL